MKNKVINLTLDMIGSFVTAQGVVMEKVSQHIDSEVLEVVIAINANSEQLWKDVRAIEGPRSKKFEELFAEGKNKNMTILEGNFDKAFLNDAAAIARLVQKAATHINNVAVAFEDECKNS